MANSNVYPKSKFILFFYRMPKSARKDPKFKKRFIHFFQSGALRSMAAITYMLLASVFTLVPSEYQWVLGILTPILREFWVWILLKVTYMAAGTPDNAATKLTGIHYMGSR